MGLMFVFLTKMILNFHFHFEIWLFIFIFVFKFAGSVKKNDFCFRFVTNLDQLKKKTCQMPIFYGII